jgi:hypothetical protein
MYAHCQVYVHARITGHDNKCNEHVFTRPTIVKISISRCYRTVQGSISSHCFERSSIGQHLADGLRSDLTGGVYRICIMPMLHSQSWDTSRTDSPSPDLGLNTHICDIIATSLPASSNNRPILNVLASPADSVCCSWRCHLVRSVGVKRRREKSREEAAEAAVRGRWSDGDEVNLSEGGRNAA